MDGIETVIHAAALKRIEVGHYNPIEMVQTNIMGAVNVIEAAQDAHVTNVVGLSTDKAYQPVSPYGYSKAMAESIFLSTVSRTTSFSVTRYGNVAGSAGSVIPKWKEILKTSDTVPVTDPDCTRFWMTMDEAIELVAGAIGKSGELVIPELPAYSLRNLAEAMNAKMDIKGLPHWEKKHESMRDGLSSGSVRQMSVEELREKINAI
jgi:UDP-N-acetylglucosamine 4,6-dehydratase